jgi:hypothetical protein
VLGLLAREDHRLITWIERRSEEPVRQLRATDWGTGVCDSTSHTLRSQP